MLRKSLGSIVLNRARRASLQNQLCTELKRVIQTGAIAPGEPMPSSRDLAADLKISRNTVVAVYDQLTGEGFLDARPRSGLFVSDSLAEAGTFSRTVQPPAPARIPAKPAAKIAPPLPFRPCQPDVRLFPLALWNRIRGRVLKSHGLGLLHYQSASPLGLPVLHRALASYLQDSRGVRCAPEQIAITTGSQQALFLLSLLLLKNTNPAYMEDPGYLGARGAFKTAQARIVPVPLDSEGMMPISRVEQNSLIYTTPSRQFPTGACMPLARRIALIKTANAARAWIVEDDYDSEFRYTRPPMPSLHSLDSSRRVIYLGTMSKVLFPSLRIGYVVLPPELIDAFGELRTIADDHGPLIDQATLAEFITTGAFYSHIRRCRKHYAIRLDTFLTTAAAAGLPLEFRHTDGGMNLLGSWKSPPAASDEAIAAKLLEHGFDVAPLSKYTVASTMRGLVFGFAALEHHAIRSGVRRMAALLRDIR